MLDTNKESLSIIQMAIGDDDSRYNLLKQGCFIRSNGAIWPNLNQSNAICLCIENGEIASAEILIAHMMSQSDTLMARKVLSQVLSMAFDHRYSSLVPKSLIL